MAWTTLFADDFNRGDDLGTAGYTTWAWYTSMPIVRNNQLEQRYASTANVGLERTTGGWAAYSYDGDQFGQITPVSGGTFWVVTARLDGNNASPSGYLLIPSSSTVYIRRIDSGSQTNIGSGASSFLGLACRLEVVGTGLEGFVNAVSKATATDSTYSSGRPNFASMGSGGGALATMDDFSFGEVSGGPIIPVFMANYRQRWR